VRRALKMLVGLAGSLAIWALYTGLVHGAAYLCGVTLERVYTGLGAIFVAASAIDTWKAGTR
jgi:hypothetical protein